MLITQVARIPADNESAPLFYTNNPQWYWDGEAMRPINEAAREQAVGG